jgi:hypothetical protein
MKIIDDFLDETLFHDLQSIVMGIDFDWNFIPMTDSIGETSDKFSGQFVHSAYENCVPRTTFFNNLLSTLSKLDAIAISRIKLNLQPRTSKIIKNTFHTDLDGTMNLETMKTWTTSIFYINSNNGYTEFESGEKVESIENRMVEFQSTLKHRGTTCTDEQTRVVINFNFVALPKK